MNKLSWLLSCIAFLALFDNIKGYFVTIDTHSEECFFDRAESGTKMGLMFETVEGGFLDIDVKITGPDGKVIYEGFRESSGKYTFAAHSTGIYTYCFNNKMSSLTTKVVMFSMDIGEAPKGTPGAANEEDANHVKLNDMIKDLAETLTAIKHEQEYMNIRDRIHRSINESTNSRVVLWSVFEAVVLIIMTVGQVYYLKRYFEVRRVV